MKEQLAANVHKPPSQIVRTPDRTSTRLTASNDSPFDDDKEQRNKGDPQEMEHHAGQQERDNITIGNVPKKMRFFEQQCKEEQTLSNLPSREDFW